MHLHALYRFAIMLALTFCLGLGQSVFAESQVNHLPLALVYKQGVDLKQYWLSEKLDGVRAYWDGEKFISKQGNVYHAPDWFVSDFPSQPLDGELWVGRNSFERVVSIVRDKKPSKDWQEVLYRVFDIPLKDVVFTDRLKALNTLLNDSRSPYIRLVKQSRVSSHVALMKKVDEVTRSGGEGLMLHKGDSFYIAGRSDDLLKVKLHQDAEARVIEHLPGKGKYTGMLGSLFLELENRKRFRLGTGFTDQQRRQPPPIGSLVTFKYYGKTKNGIPKFASFMRIRRE